MNTNDIFESPDEGHQRSAWSVSEAALHLGVSERLVRKAIADGSLRAVTLRRRVLIPATAVDELLRGSAPPEGRRRDDRG